MHLLRHNGINWTRPIFEIKNITWLLLFLYCKMYNLTYLNQNYNSKSNVKFVTLPSFFPPILILFTYAKNKFWSIYSNYSSFFFLFLISILIYFQLKWFLLYISLSLCSHLERRVIKKDQICFLLLLSLSVYVFIMHICLKHVHTL